MRISDPIGSRCVGGEPAQFTVTDCALDYGDIVWTFPYKPVAAPDPNISHIGNGVFRISVTVSGSYVIEGSCCG